ncbi:MAG: rhomboid family intramembrane serine protease [Hymenobacteraceae bacterium]|nr:rhomboid family intramembrane serine protease [Hymenobacteraceae bacterium]MDX5397700.1 rhomboid family intramembrane serine protease [Hymenobacteraceae bacterium]MDX5513778.1 rhomboid family intramembrane serine protease [Hymenobacteraceae bacterium]
MNSIFDDIKGTFQRRDDALKQLILINVIVFVALIILKTVLYLAGGLDYYYMLMNYIALPSNPLVLLTRPWTLISYFFTHEGFLHIIFNMLNLYWFGMLVREYLGDKKLVSLYFLGGLAGGVLYLLFYNFIPVYANRAADSVMIGASASVLAVIVAAATLLPNYSFNLILLGPVRIKYIAAFLVLISISGMAGGNAGGNIAHIGGAVLGFIFIKQLQRGNDLGKPIHAIGGFFKRIFQKRPKMKVTTFHTGAKRTTYTASKTSGFGKPSQAEIDLILDKISQSGYESLSKEEKQKLFQASQKE